MFGSSWNMRTVSEGEQMNKIEVYNTDGVWIGSAASFGMARSIQRAALPERLQDAYAGIGTSGQPLFYKEALNTETVTGMIDGESA